MTDPRVPELQRQLAEAREEGDKAKQYTKALALRLEEVLTARADAADSSLSRLREHALKVLKGFGDGVFVRNTSGDNSPDWAIKALPYISALAHLEVEAKRLLATEPQTEKP